jgi:hypothetical protein
MLDDKEAFHSGEIGLVRRGGRCGCSDIDTGGILDDVQYQDMEI